MSWMFDVVNILAICITIVCCVTLIVVGIKNRVPPPEKPREMNDDTR